MWLILDFDISVEKCKICILKKIIKQPFPNVNPKFGIIDLIHSGLCDLHSSHSLGNKKYVTTFFDYLARFC